jgi:hypothetical protein
MEDETMYAVADIITAPPMESMFIERRCHERLEVQSGAIASPKMTVLGQIMNVSQGGLVFRYVASRKRSHESKTLNIALTDGSFRLEWIPFIVVWDVSMPQSYSCGGISLRYCGVRFGNLTDSQKLQLRYFVKNYTTAGREE